MLATNKTIARTAFGVAALHYVKEFFRIRFEVRDIGVQKSFLEAVAGIELWYQQLEVVDACGGTMIISGCARCKKTNVFTHPYDMIVFRGSIFGRKHGRLRWRLPTCAHCDTILPPAELTSPILVYHGKRRDGFEDLPPRVLKFLCARLDTDQ